MHFLSILFALTFDLNANAVFVRGNMAHPDHKINDKYCIFDNGHFIVHQALPTFDTLKDQALIKCTLKPLTHSLAELLSDLPSNLIATAVVPSD